MKSTFFLAAFHLWSAFSAVAQMANLQIAKPGDSLILEIRTQPGAAPLPKATYVISEKGTLKLPLLKEEIPAVGIQFKDLVLRINEAFAASGIQPVPSVERISFPAEVCCPHIVTVGGNIQTPSEVGLRQGMTLMAAIDKAGGFSKTADPSRVKLVRADKKTIYDLREIKADGSNNPVLMDGDEVVVAALSEKPAASGLLRPGDSVLIALKQPEADSHRITTIYTVSDQGTLKLPLLKQEIPAVGLSTTTLARTIEGAYVKEGIFESPIIGVTLPPLIRMPEKAVSVGGEVRSSGDFSWTKGMTLMEAIKKAGGFTEFAALRRVKIIRDNKELVYDLREIKPDGSNNSVLMDGDQVIVPAN